MRSIERFMRARQGRRDFRAEYRAERERNASLRVSHDRLLAAAKYIAAFCNEYPDDCPDTTELEAAIAEAEKLS